MAYEKQTWSCGETITADKLNHMEDGIMESGGGTGNLVIEFSETGTPDPTNPGCTRYYSTVTAQEAINVMNNGGIVVVKHDDQNLGFPALLIKIIDEYMKPDNVYLFNSSTSTYYADSENEFIYNSLCDD